MTKKEKIFKALWHKHTELILAHIYQKGEVKFEELVKEFPKLCSSAIRIITNRLVRAKLIKSIIDKSSTDKRKRVYIIADETAVIAILELEL